jgi:hypothetical protein
LLVDAPEVPHAHSRFRCGRGFVRCRRGRHAPSQTFYPASGGWVGVAAAGTIDEGDLGKIVLNTDGSAAIRPTINTSAKLRFQIPETRSLIQPNPRPDEVGSLVFVMRARDNGSAARVIATLRRVWLGFFVSRPERADVVATIDTDRDINPPSDGWVTFSAHSYSSCCWIRTPNVGTREALDFFDAGYFVEVQLIKNTAEGNPGIWSVAVTRGEP